VQPDLLGAHLPNEKGLRRSIRDQIAWESLRTLPGRRAELGNGTRATRCGRNAVWRLDLAGGESLFVTFCRDSGDFSRRLFGLTVSAELARSDARFMAADIELADETAGTIVTRPIGGSSLAALFVDGFRFDRNPLGFRGPRELVRAGLDAASEWLAAFQHSSVIRPATLYDHSLSGSWARSRRRLSSPAFDGYPHLQGIRDRYDLQSVEDGNLLVMGDATLGNLYFDGSRAGAIDFEDVGVGHSCRDYAQLAADVCNITRHPLYASDRRLATHFRPALYALIDIELLVNRFVASARRPWPLRLSARRTIARAIDQAIVASVADGCLRPRERASP
jgi:hypothetical protein